MKEEARRYGEEAYALASEIFPINRSLTGEGVRKTLEIFKRELPELVIHEVSSGSSCFDWVVPDEWNVREAYVENGKGDRVIDFKDHNLHLMGYSEPVNRIMSLEELDKHLYSIPEQPDAIPYITSYYKKRWGFSLTHRQRERLSPGEYKVVVDSTLEPGVLNYAELCIPGSATKEVFFSTYICHPSMANNETSGPALAVSLAKWLSRRDLRFSYRFIFIPETIGSICYISRNFDRMRRDVIAGFNLSCVGDDRSFSYLPSRTGQTLADKVALHVLQHAGGSFRRFSFLDRGSDERQYCSPLVDLPLCSMLRSKFGTYPEYHTSLDDLNLISPEGFSGSFYCHARAIECLERNRRFVATVCCEPQMGKRGLYPTVSSKGHLSHDTKLMMDLLALSDGTLDLVDLAERLGRPVWELYEPVSVLASANLLELTNSVI